MAAASEGQVGLLESASMPEAELAKAADARGQARPHVQSPWALWTKLQNFGRKFEQVDDKDLAPAQVDAVLPPETPASQPSVPSSSLPASSLPSFFRARWPSLWARLSSWVRPLADIYFVVALCVLYATPTPRPDSPQAWRVVKAQSWAFVWIPFVYRFFTGFVHFLLGLAIMPGSILYMPEPGARFLPKALRQTVKENNLERSKRRDALIRNTNGHAISLVTPDGVQLDAVYWAGHRASRTGVTVVRLNGNAEAFELQDDQLPTMYAARGLNVLLFNYRGVGGSRWSPVWGSQLFGHILGIWRMPAAAGLQLDGWTVLQFLLEELRVPPSQICVVGHSVCVLQVARQSR